MCESLQGAARAKGVIVLLPDETGGLAPRVVKLRRPDEKVQLSRTVIDTDWLFTPSTSAGVP
jgi:hypothetical protein